MKEVFDQRRYRLSGETNLLQLLQLELGIDVNTCNPDDDNVFNQIVAITSVFDGVVGDVIKTSADPTPNLTAEIEKRGGIVEATKIFCQEVIDTYENSGSGSPTRIPLEHRINNYRLVKQLLDRQNA